MSTAADAGTDRPAPTGLRARLHQEWEHLAGAPSTLRRLRRWGSDEPALAGWPDLHALRAAVHDRRQPERADQILAALVRHAAPDRHHDQLAARVVLQLLIPGAVQLARSIRWWSDPATAEEIVFGELAIGIATYPWRRRPRRVAANLLLDCRQRITRRQRRHRLETTVGLGPPDDRPDTTSVEQAEASVAIRELLDWARRHQVIDSFECQLLLASHVQEIPMQRLADALGRSRSGLFALRGAAERRLREALRASEHLTQVR